MSTSLVTGCAACSLTVSEPVKVSLRTFGLAHSSLPISIDEAFLDVTGSRALFGDGPTIARLIKAAVHEDVGLTASVGVAANKLVAKVASDLRKPDGLVVVSPGEEAAFLAPLPIGRLWGVGAKTAVVLADYGVRTIGDLAALDPTAPVLEPVELSRTEQAIGIDDEARRPTVVVLGAGRVGRVVVSAVRTRGFRCLVVDRDARRLETVRRLGATTVFGDAANIEILKRLGLDRARVLIIAVGDPLTARLAAERARKLNPRLSIASRARGRREIETLQALEVGRLADPEAEAAFELARHALQRMGVSGPELNGIVTGLRRDAYGRDLG